MVANPYSPSPLDGAGTPEDPVHVRVVRPAGPSIPWWAITVATVAVSFVTQRFLARRFT